MGGVQDVVGSTSSHDFSGLDGTAPRGPSAGWILVALLVVATASYLYGESVPGMIWPNTALAMPVLALLALVFVLRSAVWGLRRIRGDCPFPRWLWAAMAIGLLLIAMRLTAAPLRLRFEVTRDEFDVAAQEILGADPPAAATDRFDRGRIGSFEIDQIIVVDEGLLFYDSYGDFFNDAGFGYFPDDLLPDGNGSFENPQFLALGGHWYAWTASW